MFPGIFLLNIFGITKKKLLPPFEIPKEKIKTPKLGHLYKMKYNKII